MSGVYWTLGVEVVFYSLVAVVLAAKGGLWSFGLAFGVASSAFWISRAADFATGGHLREAFASIEGSTFGQLLILNGCYFAVGIALWAIDRDGWSVGKAASLAVFLLAGCVANYAGGRLALIEQGGPGSALEAPLLWLLAVALIWASIRFQPAVWRMFNRFGPATRTLGLATYPLYLVHSEVGRVIMLDTAGHWVALALAIASVILIAFMVVKLERWPRAWLGAIMRQASRLKCLRPSSP